MPTPVSTARQCLTPEAAHALDEAVSVARRRGHGQTTSLHAVSALLSLPSSMLRDACARARNSAYSPRLQFKALELCLSVSLDRVPANQLSSDEPPVSNSLMAAIKRSQANQRRQPENFHLYQQISQQQNSTSMSCIKVELQNLILSILDDPVVSRVFGEAGFPSSEIKLAIIRPLPQVFKFSRFKAPPVFLCNLGENSDLGSSRRGFSFPFLGFTGNFNGDENCRRIGEVLARNKARNPLLVGVCANEALASFSDGIEKRKDKILPVELLGISVISIENDITKFQRENSDQGCLDLRFEQLGKQVEQNQGSGLVLILGDLKSFGNELSDSVSHVVENLTKLLQINGKKVWLIGSISSYEGYLKLVSRFPSIEKEWDLQLLPITSVRTTSMAESYPRSSLMESFVPFGGFFSELNSSSSSSHQSISRCNQCNDKCEQEVVAVTKGGFVSSVADQYQSTLPSWLRMTEPGSHVKTRDDGVAMGAKVVGVKKKWDAICRHLHCDMVSGFHPEKSTFASSPNASKPTDQPKKLLGVPLFEEDHHSVSNSSLAGSNRESPVTTDLGLTISPVPTRDNSVSGNRATSSSSSSSHDFSGQFDSGFFKKIFGALVKAASWQDEAASVISQTIADKRNDGGQGAKKRGIWLNFQGTDRFGMKKIAVALAELVYGSKESLISVDLSPENFLSRDGPGYDVTFRGKTIIDYVGVELYKKPLSVVFLENVDKAEAPTQKCLSHAVETGRFSYSNGREVGTSNAIIVTASKFTDDDEVPESRKDSFTYSEEKILGAKGYPMQLLLEENSADKWGQSLNLSMLVNKRKLVEVTEVVKRAHITFARNLDLNFPAEDDDARASVDSDSSKTWLLDFFDRFDRTVVFKPFDFDALACRMVDDISRCFRKIVGFECSFKVDPKVLEQLLAAAYQSSEEGVVERWVEEVLSRGFVEFSKRYKIKADSVVKLVSCKGMFLGEQMPGGVHLPLKILF